MGLIHIYCGSGKGKTTAAAGLSIRAAGRGIPVIFAQFLKGDTSGEIRVLERLETVTVMHAPICYGFTFRMSGEEKESAKKEYEQLFERACGRAGEIAGTEGDKKEVRCLLVLDEVVAVCSTGLLDSGKVTRWLKEKPAGLEVVLTGRDPDPEWRELADYVSEIIAEKHPYSEGVTAREGIEF